MVVRLLSPPSFQFIQIIQQMKKIIIIIAMLWCLPAIAQMKSATLTASGLTCSMCSKAIFKALQKVPFIKTVDADVEKSSYAITFKDGEQVVLDDVKKAVQDAGFSVASMQVTASFENTEVYNDAHLKVGGSTLHFLNVPKQVLTGDKTFKIVDKNYLSVSERKKYRKFTKMECFETGMMGSCCPGEKSAANRVYHVTI